jgi:hypothetical protein
MRQNKDLEILSDSAETESALELFATRQHWREAVAIVILRLIDANEFLLRAERLWPCGGHASKKI